MTTTPVDQQLPRIVDDVWEPPPRTGPNRRPVLIAAAVLLFACATFVTVRAGVFDRDAAPVEASRALWYPDPIDGVGFPSPRAPAPVASPARQPVRPAPAPPAARAPVRRAPAAPAARAPVRPAPAPVPYGRATVVPGYLAVNSMPWAVLSVDGRVVGNTPQPRIGLSPGRHRLVFARDGFAAETTWVVVTSGATVKLTGIRLTPVEP